MIANSLPLFVGPFLFASVWIVPCWTMHSGTQHPPKAARTTSLPAGRDPSKWDMHDSTLPQSWREKAVKIALGRACSATDPTALRDLISVARRWAKHLEEPAVIERLRKGKHVPERGLLRSFALEAARRKLYESQDKALAADFAAVVVAESWVQTEQRLEAIKILKQHASVEACRAIGISILRNDPQLQGGGGLDLRLLIDQNDVPAIREVVRVQIDRGLVPDVGIRLLAHYGDKEILPDLKRLIVIRVENPRFIEYLRLAIWQIAVQHPPIRLLEYVASDEELHADTLRAWALERALELGVPRVKARESALRYGERLLPMKDAAFSMRLSMFKSSCIELGILNKDDLKGVELYKPRIPKIGCR